MADANAEVGKNCGSCKKALKNRKRYYRENGYYCNKNCYKKKQADSKPAEQPAN